MAYRILVIEDNPSVRAVLSRMLEGDGHTVVSASNAIFGLRFLEEDRFDLIVTDIIMPSMDGFELLRALRGAAARPPVIAVSGGGRASADYLAVAKTLGADACLSKPVTSGDLRTAIARLMPPHGDLDASP